MYYVSHRHYIQLGHSDECINHSVSISSMISCNSLLAYSWQPLLINHHALFYRDPREPQNPLQGNASGIGLGLKKMNLGHLK